MATNYSKCLFLSLSHRHRLAVIAAGVCLMGGHSRLMAEDAAPRTFQTQPDAACQAAIASVAASADRIAMDAAVNRLVLLNDGDLPRLIPQLLLYAARNQKNPAARSVVGHALKRLDDAKHEIVAALAPLLDDADPAIQELTRGLLREYEDRSAVRPSDFTAYHAILEADFRAGRPPQASLVVFMYESNPGAALLTLIRASQLRRPDEIKPIIWAEHVVADLLWRRQFGFVEPGTVDPAVVRELDKLSQHASWWARLYVAEIIRSHPELGTQSIRDRLAGDPNALVRKATPPPIRSN